MTSMETALRMRIYISALDQWHGEMLSDALIAMAKREGLAGASVFKGMEGFGAHSTIHRPSIARFEEDLPVVVEFVDQPDRIAHIRPLVSDMVREGMVTLDPVEVAVYRDRRLRPFPSDLQVREIMNVISPVTLETPISEVATALAGNAAGIVAVIERDTGAVKGVITNTDLIAHAGMPLRPRVAQYLREHGHPITDFLDEAEVRVARDVMTAPVGVVGVDEPAWEAADQMARSGLKALPVIDAEGHYVGMVSRVDVLRMISDTVAHPTPEQRVMRAAQEGRVADVMRHDVPTVRPDARIPDVLDALLISPIHRVLVTDAERRVLGIIGDADLVERLQPEARTGWLQRLRGFSIGEREMRALARQTASEVMHREVVTIDPGASLVEALTRMLDLHIRLLPVVDVQQRLVGYVARDLLLAALIAPDDEPRTTAEQS
jgi:CBS-domain-containing membrane protein